MIDPVHEVIFVGNLERRSNERARAVSEIARGGAGSRSLEEIQKRFDRRIHGHDARLVARMAVEEIRVRALEGGVRNDSKLGLSSRHFGPYCCSTALTQSFIG